MQWGFSGLACYPFSFVGTCLKRVCVCVCFLGAGGLMKEFDKGICPVERIPLSGAEVWLTVCTAHGL